MRKMKILLKIKIEKYLLYVFAIFVGLFEIHANFFYFNSLSYNTKQKLNSAN